MRTTDKFTAEEIKYLTLLGRSFPNIELASTEIINLEAILNLPKGTEHFLSDLHGEYEAFDHVLRNASGAVERKVNYVFGNQLRDKEIKDLCTLIYYPKERLEILKRSEENIEEWYKLTLIRLVKVCRAVASKYTRSKVRKALPEAFSYIIQELMHETEENKNKTEYVSQTLNSIISIGRSDAFIVAMCELIQRLVIDRLHIVGDVYDRGHGAHHIMDKLATYHDFDIQWGNHDIVWMGAAAGNKACIANVLRMALKYANLTTIEEGYGIHLLPLATFAMETYGDDPCEVYSPKMDFADGDYNDKNIRLIAQMHKAITIIQWKLEHDIIARRPEWNMADRDLLHRVDFDNHCLNIDGNTYNMRDTNFPTVDTKDPYKLSFEESILIQKLHRSFVESTKLAEHLRILLDKGSTYLVCNGNLLFHASVPLDEKGFCKAVTLSRGDYAGKDLLDEMERLVLIACSQKDRSEEYDTALDYMWYWWCGADSPMFDKDRMTTFERYNIADKSLHKETKGHYYTQRNNAEVCDRILDEFGVKGTHRHIINGHVPVIAKKGEKAMSAGNKVIVIDGGFSRAYHEETGIAGYTLVFNSHGLQLVQHEPFESRQKAIQTGVDIKSTRFLVDFDSQQLKVSDTEIGKQLKKQVTELKRLLEAYRMGAVKYQ